ncbi:MAG: hypothetical protein ACREOZ_04635, partial [Gloeomargaritales cyanobacterium]
MNVLGHITELVTVSVTEMKAVMMKIAKYQHDAKMLKKPMRERIQFDAASWQTENHDLFSASIGDSPSSRFIKAIMFSPGPSMQGAANLLDLYGLDACHLSWGDSTLFSVYGLSSNFNTVCLSHAIVSGNEDFESWSMFIKFVKKCYPH